MEEIKTALTKAFDAVSFDRIVVMGFLVILLSIVLLSAALAFCFPEGNKTVQDVLELFKALAYAFTGALANSVRQHIAGGGGNGQ